MFDRDKLLRDIKKPDTKLFFAKAADKLNLALKTYQPAFTYFIDPSTAVDFMKAVGFSSDAEIAVYGGYEGAERVMIGFFPEYTQAENNLFPIEAIEVRYNGKYGGKLSHRDFLGSVMGLGITRERIGDIIIKDEGAIIISEREIAGFICSNLERVGRIKVGNKIIDINSLEVFDNGVEMNITAASLRIDSILSKGFNISRGKASDYISAEKVFLNWQTVYGNADGIKENDIITVRGLGRIKITEIVGKTKKDRILIRICRYS